MAGLYLILTQSCQNKGGEFQTSAANPVSRRMRGGFHPLRSGGWPCPRWKIIGGDSELAQRAKLRARKHDEDGTGRAAFRSHAREFLLRGQGPGVGQAPAPRYG